MSREQLSVKKARAFAGVLQELWEAGLRMKVVEELVFCSGDHERKRIEFYY